MKLSRYIYLITPALILLSCGKTETLLNGSGLIEATEVTLSSQVNGQLIQRYFDEGQKIASGDTVALIDTSRVMLNLRQSQAMGEVAKTRLQASGISIKQASFNIDLAKKELDRAETLVQSGSANQEQFDQAKNAYNQALLAKQQAESAQNTAQADFDNSNAQIALLQKQFNDCTPTSPTSGIVVDKFVEPGELLNIGKPIIKIANLDTVWVKIYLPAGDLPRISLGGHATVDPENGAAPLYGAVSWISSEAEFTPKNVQTKEARADLVYAVKVTIPNSGQILKIGMPVMVTVR
jgi:HlyD family secretion protein